MTPTTDPDRLPPMSRGMIGGSIAAFFLLGVAVAWFVFANPLGLEWLGGRDAPAAATTQEPETVYQCPMHPSVVEGAPGDCPICGMPLVLVGGSADDPAAEDDVIRIDPVQVQNTGVVSVPAEVRDMARSSRTVGILDFNTDGVTWINTKYEGWIETVHVAYVGQDVRRGEPLFDIYSPELVTTQEEYLRALEYRDSLRDSGRPGTLRQAEDLVRSTRDRLRNWDVDDAQIAVLESGRTVRRLLTVTSPADGIIAEILSDALEGMHVRPGMNLYKIADLSTVWVHADVYELDIPWIRAGQPAVVSFRNDPDARFQGRVLFLYPEVSRDTRTLKICVEVPNANGRLRPGMFADVTIQGGTVPGAVVVPRSAVIRTGERDVLFVDLGEGRFEPREVKLGIGGEGDDIQVLEGIAAGERVVTQTQFLLDSESRMQEAIGKFRERNGGGR